MAFPYGTTKDNVCMGMQSEATFNTDPVGTAPTAGLIVMPMDIDPDGIKLNWQEALMPKQYEPQLGNTWVKKITEPDSAKPQITVEGKLCLEYIGYGSFLGKIMGVDPAGASGENSTAGAGTISAAGTANVKSFTAEWGWKSTAGSAEYSILSTGTKPNRLTYIYEESKETIQRLNLIAAEITPSTAFVTRVGGTEADALTPLSTRRALWADTTFTWSNSLTPELSRFEVTIDRDLLWNHHLNAAKPSADMPYQAYIVTGTAAFKYESGENEFLDLSKAGPGAVAGTHFVDSIQVTTDAATGCYHDFTLDDVAFKYAGDIMCGPGRSIRSAVYDWEALAQISGNITVKKP